MAYYLDNPSSTSPYISLTSDLVLGSNVGDYIEFSLHPYSAMGTGDWWLAGKAGSYSDFIAMSRTNVKIRRANAITEFPIVSRPAYDVDVKLKVERVSSLQYEIFINDVSIGVDGSSTNTMLLNQFFRLSNANNGWRGRVYDIKASTDGGATVTNIWDASASSGTGSILPDTVGSNDGTLVSFPTDDSQWVFYGGGANTSDIDYAISTPLFASNSTVSAPANISDIDYTISAPTFASNSTVSAPVFDSTVAYSTNAPTFVSTGTVINPAGATVIFTIDEPTFNANSTNTVPSITGNIDFDISAPLFSASANNGAVQRASNIDFTVLAPTFSANSTITIPDIIGDIEFAVFAPLFSVIAGTDADVYYYSNGTQLALPVNSRLITLSAKTRQVRV